MAVRNTPAYYNAKILTLVKNFIVQASDKIKRSLQSVVLSVLSFFIVVIYANIDLTLVRILDILLQIKPVFQL